MHGPFTPAERHKDLFADETIVRTANAKDNLDGKPVLQRMVNGQRAAPGDGSSDDLIKNQLRCLTAIDEGVGRIWKALEDTKQLDNTFIVFTSDNGYFWGEHHLGDKRWAYEESIRIPMLMRYPKRIKAGSKIAQMVMNVDMAPTMLDLVAFQSPPKCRAARSCRCSRGQSKAGGRRSCPSTSWSRTTPRVPSWQAVRNERWKYVHYTELKGMDELYDLKSDPLEMKNLIFDAASTLEGLKKDLDHFNSVIR